MTDRSASKAPLIISIVSAVLALVPAGASLIPFSVVSACADAGARTDLGWVRILGIGGFVPLGVALLALVLSRRNGALGWAVLALLVAIAGLGYAWIELFSVFASDSC